MKTDVNTDRIHTILGAFDGDISAVALSNGYYESADLVLLSGITNAPNALRRIPLHVSVGGFTIGSQERDVENSFGYGHVKRAKTVQNCGMVAERFQIQGTGASAEYAFVYKNRQVVALEYSGGS